MSQVKRDDEEFKAARETKRMLERMIELLDDYPFASVAELHRSVCDEMQLDMEDEELSRKLDKDD